MHLRTTIVCALALGVLLPLAFSQPDSAQPAENAKSLDHAGYTESVEALSPLAETDAGRAWLQQGARLPAVPERTVHIGFRPKRGYSAAEFAALPEADREGLRPLVSSAGQSYYETFYGSPLAYLRALDLAAKALGEAGKPFAWSGARVLDFGYGQIGQLRMLAQCGAHAVGVDVDPILQAIYDEPGAEGAVEVDGRKNGSVILLHGHWPNDNEMRAAVRAANAMQGYDLIVARNILKRGYVAPVDGSDPMVDLGAPEEVLGAFYEALAPGGVLVIYSIGGEPDPAKPMTDIASPWSQAQFEASGFELLTHDANENAKARAVGRALGWDQGERPMDLEQLFGVYTIARRPSE